MLIWTTIRVAFESLLSNRLRSVLAMLGIIIGVGAVISMLAVGSGAQKQVTTKVSNMGTNLLSVRPTGMRSKGVVGGSNQNLTIEDAEAILAKIPAVKEVVPVVRETGQIKYLTQNSRAMVIGTAVTYFTTKNLSIGRGRLFTENEVETPARVAVIGAGLAEDLFAASDPVGECIRINGSSFQVVGVMKPKGDRDRDNPDEAVIVPYKVVMKTISGATWLQDIDICGAAGCDMSALESEIGLLLRKRHRIAEGGDDDFRIFNQAELLEAASEITRTFTVLLGSIAGISMLVGGIGIMNMMLLTVTERTREIGVRKAIGAQDSDILRQFVLEAVLISSLGGFFGVLLGCGVALGIEHATNYPTVVELQSVLFAFSISVALGVFFGYYPAYQASQLDPIDALRFE